MRVRLLFSTAALLGLVLAGCAASGARITQTDASESMVRGTVAYRERMALPTRRRSGSSALRRVAPGCDRASDRRDDGAARGPPGSDPLRITLRPGQD